MKILVEMRTGDCDIFQNLISTKKNILTFSVLLYPKVLKICHVYQNFLFRRYEARDSKMIGRSSLPLKAADEDKLVKNIRI